MRSIIRLVALFTLLVAPLPAAAQLWDWSQTPANNATVDPSINWAEGMPPSAVNDSARATMAGIAKYRDDHSGLVTLTGGPTAYTATTNQGNQSGGISSLVAGYQLCFAPNVANGATDTLAVDSQAAKPIRSQPATELVGGELRPGTPYCVTYFTSNGGEYILNNDMVPAATSLAVGSTPISGGTPNDCLSVNGAGTTLANIACVTTIGASGLLASALGSYEQPINLQLNATAASNQLTFAVVGVNGSNPSSSNPVLVNFRSQTTSNGTAIFGSVQAATSFTLASTSSMGCTTAVICRLWVEMICQTESGGNCTSALVAASVQSNTTQCFPLMENQLQTTGSGTTGGTTINTIFTSASALSNKAIRIIGYVQATWTNGTGWSISAGSAADPSVQVFSPGMHKPCDIVQTAYTSSGANSTTTNNWTSLTTLPTTAMGKSAFSLTVTPTSALNLIEAVTQLQIGPHAGGVAYIAYIVNNSGTAVAASVAGQAGALGSPLFVDYLTQAAAISAQTWQAYFSSTSGTVGLNDNTAGTAMAGGIQNSYLLVKEIMG